MQKAWTLITSHTWKTTSGHRLFARKHAMHTTASRSAVTKYLMPAMSPTMTEGSITNWKLKEGDSFSAGDVLLEIETDKAQIDVEAQEDGFLAKILVPAGGNKIAVNEVIALLAEEGDTLTKEDLDVAPKGPSESSAPAEPQQTAKAPAPSVDEKYTKKGETVYFPSVARLLAVNELDPTAIQGTGPKGRLLKGDVLKVLKQGGGVKAPSQPAKKSLTNQPVAHSTIISGAKGAKTTVPRFVLQREIPLGSSRIPLIIQAASKALRATPRLNIQYAKNPRYSAEEVDDVSLASEYLMSEPSSDKSNGKSSVEISLRAGSDKRVIYKNADEVQPEKSAGITMDLLKQSIVETKNDEAKALGLSSSTFAGTYDRTYFESGMEPTYINVAETIEQGNKETYTDLIDYFGGQTMAKHETKQAVVRFDGASVDAHACSFLDGFASPAAKTRVSATSKEPEVCTIDFSFDYRLVDPVVAEEFVDMVEKYAQSGKREERAA